MRAGNLISFTFRTQKWKT